MAVGNFVVQLRAVKHADHAARAVNRKATASIVVQAVGHGVGGAVRVRGEGGDAHDRAVGGVFSNGVGGGVGVADRADGKFVGVVDGDGHRLGVGKTTAVGRDHIDAVTVPDFVVRRIVQPYLAGRINIKRRHICPAQAPGDAVARIHVGARRGVHHGAGGEIFIHAGAGAGGDARRVVGAVDGHLHGSQGAVGRCHRERVGDGGADVQVVKGAVGGEAPGAGRGDAERAGRAGRGGLRHKGRWAVHVADAQRAAGAQGGVGLSQRHHGGGQERRDVGALDFYGSVGPTDRPSTEPDGVGEGVCPRSKRLEIGRADCGHGVQDFAVRRDSDFGATCAELHRPNLVLYR